MHRAASLAILGCYLLGCGSNNAPDGADGGMLPDGGAPARYAVVTHLLVEPDSITYVNVLDSLDNVQIDYSAAYEIPGYASIAAFDGALFLADSEAPILTRYRVNASRRLETVDRLDLTSTFAEIAPELMDPAIYVDTLGVTFVDAHHAYLAPAETLLVIVFDPTTMEVIGHIPAPTLEAAGDGMTLLASSLASANGHLFRVASWMNFETGSTAPEQYVVDYDLTTMTASVTAETRCGMAVSSTTVDEAGHLYASSFVWAPAQRLFREGQPTCAFRFTPPGASVDDWVLDFRTITGGLDGAELHYLGGGEALLSVFDYAGAEPDDLLTIVGDRNWKLWIVDVESREAHVLEGLNTEDAMGVAPTSSVSIIDGRTFIEVARPDTTGVYEIVNGRTMFRFETSGYTDVIARIE